MSRALTSGVAAAIAGGHVPLVMLVELESSSGWLRVNSSAIAISWGGYTWHGAGRVLSVEPIEETGDVSKVPGMSIRLSGIDPAHIDRALDDHYQGRAANLYLAALNSDHVVIVDPVLVWAGRMDTMTLEIGQTATVVVTAESRLADWDRPRIRRYNSADQQATYATDKGFEYVEEMVEKQLVWGTR